MSLPFWKVQSVGNHFALVVGALEREDWSQIAIDICTHKFGIGADGLLTMWLVDGAVRLDMYNPDGTADFCGNGLRCAALVASREYGAGDEFLVHHGGREVVCSVDPGGKVTSTLPPATFESGSVPIESDRSDIRQPVEIHGVRGYPISTGSTHFVVFVDEPLESKHFEDVSRKIEIDSAFPCGTSIMWAKRLQENEFSIQIWERGVGETYGCGTGAAAVAVVDALLKGTGGEYIINSKGGATTVAIEAYDSQIVSSTVPTIVYKGNFLSEG